ncbi:MAG: hypothetical protein PHD67_04155 [Oscillospiraceae bacterium]|nr:hypothetical protein [Oscillospiraceae bacterium]
MKSSKAFALSFLLVYLLLGLLDALSVSTWYAFSAGVAAKAAEYLIIALFGSVGYKLLAAGLISIAVAFGVRVAACLSSPGGRNRREKPLRLKKSPLDKRLAG